MNIEDSQVLDSPLLPQLLGYVDGTWRAADSGRTLSVMNPLNGATLGHVPCMGQAETSSAIESAARAMAQPSSPEERSGWLEQVASLMEDHRDELGRIITHENGKPWAEGRSEADYAASFFRYYAGCLPELDARRLAARPRGHSWMIHARPAGVVALISPWNFPLAMMAKKFSAALATGCACVIRPSSKTPLSMIALFSLLERIGLPAGRANLVIGPADEISRVFCEHPTPRVISFTGSTAVGRQLLRAGAHRLKRFAIELGGNAPFIVFADADLDRAVDHLVANKFRGSGQTCVCTNRVYVQREILEPFTEKLVARVDQLRSGNGMQPGVDLGPLIDRRAHDKVLRHLQDALSKGAHLVSSRREFGPASADFGCFFPPVVLRGVTSEMDCVRGETFGPLVPIIEFQTEQEAVDWSNQTEFGLAAYVFTEDEDRADRVVAQLQFGHVGHNTGTGPTAEAPFGGMKQSGQGREGGLVGLHEFIEWQTVPRGK
jgi:succinate-semialdehyde dehydrogenase/glutarate-semialdehyde dehydrogenase